jgi:hypothetical protein
MRALPVLVLPLAVLFAGCAVEPLPPTEPAAAVPPAPEAMAECKAEPAQRFVGQRVQPSTPEAARLASGSREVRVIRPGTMVTKDYRLDRLNLDVDAREMVTAVRCG